MITLHMSSYQLDDKIVKVELACDENDRQCFKILLDGQVVYKFTTLDQAMKCFELVVLHKNNFAKIFDGLV
jgi:hypothetical protein